MDGVNALLTPPSFSSLGEVELWTDVAVHVFWSLGVGTGEEGRRMLWVV